MSSDVEAQHPNNLTDATVNKPEDRIERAREFLRRECVADDDAGRGPMPLDTGDVEPERPGTASIALAARQIAGRLDLRTVPISRAS
jgi:hypothetical protein